MDSAGSGFADPASVVRALALRERECTTKHGLPDLLTRFGIFRLHRWYDWGSGLGI